MKKGVKWFSLPVVAALCLGTAAPARAVEVKAGSWDLSFTGNVNAFATYQVCGESNSRFIGGVPLACSKAKDAPNTFSIESGLLPNALVFGAKTRQFDVDTSVTIGFYPGLHVSDTRTGAASTAFSVDVRQGFLTFGDKSWGTVKLGKDLGVFGGDAILSDMTLLGVGAGASQLLNHNVTIGHIGSGYIYADWIPQVAYISPSFSGLQVTLAAIEAFRVDPTGGNDLPGVQAKVSYDFAGPVSGKAWAGGMYQNAKVNSASHPSLNSIAGEAGVKVSASGLGGLAYGYYGKGIGTTLIGLDASAGLNAAGDSVEGRKSYGFLGQVTYQIPNSRLRPGISYGMSFIDLASGETDPGFLKSNAVATAALFYALTDSLTLVAEVDHARSKGQDDRLAHSNSGALGAIMFF